MNAQTIKSKVPLLWDRDGGRCWLCDGILDINAPLNTKKRPTVEHLVAISKGGSRTDLSNLVLCHSGCNHQLRDRPREEKEKIRAKMALNRQKKMSNAAAPAPKAKPKPVPSASLPPRAVTPAITKLAFRPPSTNWQRLANTAIAVGALGWGIAIGMMVER